MQRQMAPEAKSSPGFILGTANGVPLQGILFRDSDSIPLRFRRLRSGRACLICHSRKVRCDASSRGMPCTNCAAFAFECTIPQKRQKRTAKSQPDSPKRKEVASSTSADVAPEAAISTYVPRGESINESDPPEDVQFVQPVEEPLEEQPDNDKILAKFISESHEASIKSPGRVSYVAELSNLSMLVHGYNSPTSVVHYSGDLVTSNRLDESELDILRRRGALILPPREVCDDLVKAYFKWVAPMVPIINKKRFMEQYRDPNNPPSLLLLQTIFLAACRVCPNGQLKGPSGTKPAATEFYKRAKALYEAHYENDRVTIVQALILISMFREKAEKVHKNTFYWTGLAVSIAQGFGMHRNAEASSLSMADKRLWKRIWWTLFARDRSTAVVFGQPVLINLESADVEMVSEDDFLDDQFTSSPMNRLQAQFFVHYVKLCQVMDLVLLRNSTKESSTHPQNAMDLTRSVMALTQWFQNCPEELKWQRSNHNFWAAQLSGVYHTTSCLLHRTHLPSGPEREDILIKDRRNYSACPLRRPIFQSAYAITFIAESLVSHNELRFSHPFFIFSLSSVLVVQMYEMYANMPAVDVTIIKRIRTCMNALDRLGETWLVSRSLYDLYDTVLRHKDFVISLEDNDRATHQNTRQSIDQKPDGVAEDKIDPPAEKDFSPGDWAQPQAKDIDLNPSTLAYMLATMSLCTSSDTQGGKRLDTKADSNNNASQQQYIRSEPSSDTECSTHLDNGEPQTVSYLPENSSQQLLKPDESSEIRLFQPFETGACIDPSYDITAASQAAIYQRLDLQGHFLSHDGMPTKTLDTQLQCFPPELQYPQYSSFTSEIRAGTEGSGYFLDNAVYTRPVELDVAEWYPDFDFNSQQ